MSSTSQSHAFARHVIAGLASTPKHLSSSWLYDDEGSRLFQRIMGLPEYYLTRVEHSILREQAQGLSSCIVGDNPAVDVIDLGSGDGAKTLTLIEHVIARCAATVYRPFDISAHAIDVLTKRFEQQLCHAQVIPTVGDYFTHWPTPRPQCRQVVLFLGSNLGNFSHSAATGFLQRIRSFLRPGDGLLLGLDMQKDPSTILAAYNDSQQVTAAFNMNLLRRINRELGADFDVDQFHHYALYSPLDGAARSFIVSRIDQRVTSSQIDLSAQFAAGECIYVEQSQKYTVPMIDELASTAGFVRQQQFADPNRWYSVAFLSAN
jgi:L-histidine Nalpha-methyltransferase